MLSLLVWHAVSVTSLQVLHSIDVEAAPPEGEQKHDPIPMPSGPTEFVATAYCESGITKSGEPTGPGVIAADPRVLPLGSIIRVNVVGYAGVYRVLDTGHFIKGKRLDIFLPNEEHAIEFGRRNAQVIVLRYGPARPDSVPLLD